MFSGLLHCTASRLASLHSQWIHNPHQHRTLPSEAAGNAIPARWEGATNKAYYGEHLQRAHSTAIAESGAIQRGEAGDGRTYGMAGKETGIHCPYSHAVRAPTLTYMSCTEGNSAMGFPPAAQYVYSCHVNYFCLVHFGIKATSFSPS